MRNDKIAAKADGLLALEMRRLLQLSLGTRNGQDADEQLDDIVAVADLALNGAYDMDSQIALALLAVRRTTVNFECEIPENEISLRTMRKEKPYLLTLRAVDRGWTYRQVFTHKRRLLCVAEWVDRFALAIAPRTLGSLAQDSEAVRERLNCFLANRKRSDDEVRKQAGVVLENRKWAQQEVEDFLDWLPPNRLRTYPEKMLVRVAENWRKWSPLVTCLRSAASSAAPVRRLEDVIKKVKQLLRTALADTSWFSCEDAVQDAILAEIQSQEVDSYCYESAYPYWLAQAAKYKLQKNSPKRNEVEFREEQAATATTEIELSGRQLEWMSRLMLAVSAFKSQNETRVKAMIDWALQNSAESARLKRDKETSDKKLAYYLKQHLGEDVKLGTIASTRYRLRQRLEAIRLLRDCEWGSQQPGDKVLLSQVRERWGLSEKDEPTLKNLAALTRAANKEKSLGWALFSKLLMETAQSSANDAFEATKMLLSLEGATSKDVVEQRLKRAKEWEPETRKRKKIWTPIWSEYRNEGMQFLLSPIWYLSVLRDKTPDETVKILLPDLTIEDKNSLEEDCIRSVIESLSKELS